MTIDSTFAPLNTEAAFLPTSTVYPDQPEQVAYAMESNYQRTAQAVNAREVAFYLTSEETLTGQVWEQTDPALVGIPYSTRSTFRKVVTIPPLVAGLNTIPHGIVGIGTSYMFVQFNGGIGNGVLWSAVPNANVLVEVDGTNLYLTVPGVYAGFTGYIALEYLKDN